MKKANKSGISLIILFVVTNFIIAETENNIPQTPPNAKHAIKT
jgi:hypothetical protein